MRNGPYRLRPYVLPRLNKAARRRCIRDVRHCPALQEMVQPGFTLLELIVALTLVGLIAAAAFGGLKLGTRAWESGNAKTDAMSQTRLTQGFLRREIAAAYPLLVETENAEKRVAFYGLKERMTFIAPLAAHLGRGGLYRLTLGFVEEGGSGRLVMHRRLYRPDQDFFADAEEHGPATVLIDGIERTAFSYFGPARPGEEALWHETWQDMTVLPLLVRLEVVYVDQRRASWPEFIIAPMIDLEAQ